MPYVAKSIFKFSVIFWNFYPERVGHFDAKRRTGIPHAIEAIVGTVKSLGQTVHDAPFLVLQVGRLCVLDFVTSIIFPEDLFGFSISAGYKSGRMQNFALYSVFLDVQVNLELAELMRGLDILQEFFNLLESISRVADFIVLKLLHLVSIGSEVVWQWRFVAKLSCQVDPSV